MKKNKKVWQARNIGLFKMIRIMRITIFLLLVTLSQTFAIDSYSQRTKLTLDFKDKRVEEVIDAIEENSEFYFLYNKNMIDVDRKIDINIIKGSVDEVLEQVFKNTDISYSIRNRLILLINSKVKKLAPEIINQQITSVSGKVTDSKGQPLPGVTVVVKGTTQGTVTNADGNYSISNISDNAILVFSFVGMKSQEIPVVGNNTINAVMAESTIGIEEVVAIGYGTMKKSDLTGSLSSISDKLFEDQPMTDLSQLLQGRGSGIIVSPTSGALGSPSKIRIRGANSISGSNDPLYIVDGFVSSAYNIHDVESVEILKDASATAIYGSRGANGVIIITTKAGSQEQKPTVTVTSNTQIGNVVNRYDLLSPAEYARQVNEQYPANPPFSSADISAYESGSVKGTDWQDEIFQTSVSQDYNVRLEGGTKKSSFYASLGITDQTGLMRNSETTNYNFSSKIQTKVNDRLDIFVKVGLGRNSRFNTGTSTSGRRLQPAYQSLIWSPTTPVYQEDGSYTKNDDYGSINVDVNPVRDLRESDGTTLSRYGTLNADIKYEILKDFTVDFMGTFSQSGSESRNFTNTKISPDGADASRSYSDGTSWQFTTLLNYNKTLAEKHHLGATAGYEMLSSESYYFSANATNLSVESVGYNNLGLGGLKDISSGYGESALLSYFGRLNYNYKEKYYLTATYRADGSSKFKGDNQFSYFPSAALSWKATNEDFIHDLGLFDVLKFRFSWGITGSQAIGAYETLARLKTEDYMWGPYSTTRYYGYVPGSPANPDLKWEQTTQTNIGIDMGFLNNKLGVTFDYFNKITSDLLIPNVLPGYSGNGTEGSVTTNVGEVQNTGAELGINYVPVMKRDFSWEINLNTYVLKNEVLDLGDNEQILGTKWLGGTLTTHNTVVGESLGSFYGYTYLGVWKSSEAAEAAKYSRVPGDAKYLDVDNNYIYGEDDLQIIGDNLPDFTWNLNNMISYKNFDFNVLIAGSHGAKILNLSYAAAALPEYDSRTITLREAYVNRWTTSNENTMFTGVDSNNNLRNSTQWLQDASFIKLRNLTVAYRIPKKLIKVGDLKLTVSGQNLFVLTNYKGYDPELSATEGNADRDSGIDSGIIPISRNFTFGASLKF